MTTLRRYATIGALAAGVVATGACGSDSKKAATEDAPAPSFTAACADPGDEIELTIEESVGTCSDSPTVNFAGDSAEGEVTSRSEASGNAAASATITVVVPGDARSGTIQIECGSFISQESTRTLKVPCANGSGGSSNAGGEHAGAGENGMAGEAAGAAGSGGAGPGGSGAGGEGPGAGGEGPGAGGEGPGAGTKTDVIDPANGEDLLGVMSLGPIGNDYSVQFFAFAPNASTEERVTEHDFHFGQYYRAAGVEEGDCTIQPNVQSTGGADYTNAGVVRLLNGSTELLSIPHVGFYSGSLPGSTPSTLLGVDIQGSAEFPAISIEDVVRVLPSPVVDKPQQLTNIPEGEDWILGATPEAGFMRAVIMIQGPNSHLLCHPPANWTEFTIQWELLDEVMEGSGQRFGYAYFYWMFYSGYRLSPSQFLAFYFEAYDNAQFSLGD